MARRRSSRTRSRRLALVLLLVFGSSVVLLGLLVLAVGLAITHHDNFHDTVGLKETIESNNDYVQYWIGLPYVFTGVSVTCSAINLRRISLTVCTIVASLICIVLSLAGMVVDGPDWVLWKDTRALQRYWERRDGFACSSVGDTCSCTSGAETESITSFTDCETLRDLSSIYGILISCFIVVMVILFASIFLIVYIITSEKEKARRQGRRPAYKAIEAIETERPQKMLDDSTHVQVNPLYSAVKQQERAKPQGEEVYREYRVKEAETANQLKKETSSVANGGAILLDPARFRLGDDDVY